jgi:hypothetical protein
VAQGAVRQGQRTISVVDPPAVAILYGKIAQANDSRAVYVKDAIDPISIDYRALRPCARDRQVIEDIQVARECIFFLSRLHQDICTWRDHDSVGA